MVEFWQWPLLFVTGAAAGFIDSIAGGGGLITLPVLLSCGFDPKLALGTNKLQATFGSGSAAWHYARAGVANWRDCWRGFGLTFIGAALGTLAVQKLDPSLLRRALPVLLASVAIYSLLRPKLGEKEAQARMSRGAFDLTFGLLLGFYDGFFGPGTGTFWAMAFVMVMGFDLTRATGSTKVMNFASNLASLAFFLCLGQVLVAAGLVMGAGQLIGAWLGSHMVIKRGTEFIRPIFITVVLVVTGKVIYDVYFK
jgi:uncharacterized membrane protein YfcA